MPSFKTANKDDVLKSGFVFVKDAGTQAVKKIATAAAFQVGLTGVPSSLAVTGNLSLSKVSYTIAGGSTATITQDVSFVGVSSTGSGVAKIKLSPGQAVGQIIYIKDEAGNAVNVNIQIDPSPAKIDGATTKTINRNYGFFQLIWSGTEWNVIAQPAPTGAGTGDVSGPGSSTDNAVVRWNGVDGENIKNSGVIIDNSDNLSVPGDVAVDSGYLTTSAAHGRLFNTNATTVSIGGAASTALNIGNTSSTNNTISGRTKFPQGLSGSLTRLTDGTSYMIAGNNISITSASNGAVTISSTGGGDVTGPASSTDNAIARFDLATGKVIQNSGVTIDDSDNLVVPGDVTVSGGKITLTNGSTIDSETAGKLILTEDLVETTGDLKVGGNDIQASDGNVNITMTSNTLTEIKGDLQVSGNDIKSSGGTTSLTLSSADVTVAGDLTVSGGKVTLTNGSVIDSETVDVLKLTESDVRIIGQTLSTDQTTFNLINSTATSLNIGGAATGIVIGAIASATTTIRGGTLVGNTTTQNLFNTTATTLNIGGAASTALNIGNTSSTNNTISGRTKFPQGLSGSLTQLTNGTSYMIAGDNIAITSASNGAVTISSTVTSAPTSAQYLVLSANSSLTDERVFVPSTGLTATNAGTDGGNYTLAINDSVVATVSGTQFKGSVGVTGSLGSTTLTVVSGVLYHANGAIKQNTFFIYDEDTRHLGVGFSSTPQANLHGNSTFRLGTTNYIVLDNSLSTTHSRWLSGGAKTTIDMDVDQTFAQGSKLGFSQTFSNTQLDLGLTWAAQGILSVSGSAPGAILRFNATSTPLAAGDLGMNVSTGRPNAFIGGAVKQLAHTDEVVVGPATSTDEAIARYDLTTGRLLQNSGVTIDDFNNVTIPGDLAVNGGATADITTTNVTAASLFNTTVPTLNVGGAATSITMGASAGTTTTIRGGTLVGNTTTQNLFNTTATTLNLGGAATSITMGDSTTATTTIRGGTLVGNTSTQNLFNTTATTLNIGGAASVALNIGNTASTNNTISGRTKFPQGLSGSLTQLTNGTSYIIAGSNVSVTSASNGAITISSLGSGDVIGPASSTDNAVARFDLTTGKLIQNSGVTIDDSNNVVVPGTLDVNGGAITTSASTFNFLNGVTFPTAINIGTTELTAGVNTITIGKKTTTGNKGTKLYLYGGDGAAGSVDIDTGGSAIYIGNGASSKAIEIGANTATANSITIGSNYLSTQLSLLGGRTSNPGLILSASVIEIGKQVGSGYLYLGRQALSGNIDIGESAIDTTITIGKNAITSEVTNPLKRTYIKIGPGATNSQINIGDSAVAEIFTYSKNTSWIDTWANPAGGESISSIKIGCLNFQRIIKIGHPGEDNAADVSGQSEKQQVYLGSSGSASWTEIYGGFSSTPNPGIERASYGGIMLSASFIEITGSYPKANLGTDATIGAAAIGSLPGSGHNATAIFAHRELGSFSTNYALKQKKDGSFDGETWLNAASGQTIYFANGGNVVGYIDNSTVSFTGGSVATTTTIGNTIGTSLTTIQAGASSGGGVVIAPSGGRLGFFGLATPVTKQTIVDLTNNTGGGGTLNTIATQGSTYNQGSLNGNFNQITIKINQIIDALQLYGLMG